MRICKHTSSTVHFPLPYSPVGKKKADLMFPNIFSSIIFSVNEAMKLIFLLFNGFHRTRIFQFAFNPIQDGRRGEVQKGCQLVSHNNFNF